MSEPVEVGRKEHRDLPLWFCLALGTFLSLFEAWAPHLSSGLLSNLGFLFTLDLDNPQ